MTVERCPWCGSDPLYQAYHDTEWGVPEHDSRALWEMLVLESFQAGLSWITILKKRDNFRRVFDGFDPVKLARWGEAEVALALSDAGIIRHRGKVEATVSSARNYLKLEEDGGFAPFIWGFVDGAPIQNDPATVADVPAETAESRALSKALKAKGFRFCGPVITYAFMQATGMVNDHLVTCHRHAPLRDAARGVAG